LEELLFTTLTAQEAHPELLLLIVFCSHSNAEGSAHAQTACQQHHNPARTQSQHNPCTSSLAEQYTMSIPATQERDRTAVPAWQAVISQKHFTLAPL
jgi:hypothetical protein